MKKADDWQSKIFSGYSGDKDTRSKFTVKFEVDENIGPILKDLQLYSIYVGLMIYFDKSIENEPTECKLFLSRKIDGQARSSASVRLETFIPKVILNPRKFFYYKFFIIKRSAKSIDRENILAATPENKSVKTDIFNLTKLAHNFGKIRNFRIGTNESEETLSSGNANYNEGAGSSGHQNVIIKSTKQTNLGERAIKNDGAFPTKSWTFQVDTKLLNKADSGDSIGVGVVLNSKQESKNYQIGQNFYLGQKTETQNENQNIMHLEILVPCSDLQDNAVLFMKFAAVKISDNQELERILVETSETQLNEEDLNESSKDFGMICFDNLEPENNGNIQLSQKCDKNGEEKQPNEKSPSEQKDMDQQNTDKSKNWKVTFEVHNVLMNRYENVRVGAAIYLKSGNSDLKFYSGKRLPEQTSSQHTTHYQLYFPPDQLKKCKHFYMTFFVTETSDEILRENFLAESQEFKMATDAMNLKPYDFGIIDLETREASSEFDQNELFDELEEELEVENGIVKNKRITDVEKPPDGEHLELNAVFSTEILSSIKRSMTLVVKFLHMEKFCPGYIVDDTMTEIMWMRLFIPTNDRMPSNLPYNYSIIYFSKHGFPKMLDEVHSKSGIAFNRILNRTDCPRTSSLVKYEGKILFEQNEPQTEPQKETSTLQRMMKFIMRQSDEEFFMDQNWEAVPVYVTGILREFASSGDHETLIWTLKSIVSSQAIVRCKTE